VRRIRSGLARERSGRAIFGGLHRRLIASATFLDCASTQATASHLKREGIPAARTLISSDTVIDALLAIAAENPQAVEAGVARVVGTSKDEVLAALTQLRRDDGAHRQMARAMSPYGGGHDAERIVEHLREMLFG
jgi:UDP-N-acetylglucosamine 2-epimerase